MQWTREDLEQMKLLDRPRVRCKFDCVFIDQDGRKTDGTKETTGEIVVDGNNPWIRIGAAGIQHAERFSWGLVCDVLNDKFAAPIWFSKVFEYEV